MSKRDEFYRDEEGVLHCDHGKKLHLACEHCEAQQERDMEAKMMWLRVVAAVSAFSTGFAVAYIYRILGG